MLILRLRTLLELSEGDQRHGAPYTRTPPGLFFISQFMKRDLCALTWNPKGPEFCSGEQKSAFSRGGGQENIAIYPEVIIKKALYFPDI